VVVAPDVDEADVPGYSVAILPFANASFEAGDMFLADGITRDLTMLLSRVPRLKVAAYSSALLCREGREPLEEIATRLGVRYVVSGSVARDDTKIFLRAALMDSQDNAQLLGKRLGAPIADFFEVQDELVLEISTALASGVQTSHVASLQGRRPFQLSAYELVQRAEALRLRYNRENAMKIVGLLDQALRIDPDDAAVHAALAVQHTQNVVSSFVPDQAETFALARRHVDRALDLAPRDPDTLAAAGIAATMMGNARLAVRHLEAAVDLDPNNPHTLAVLGWQHCWIHGTLEGLDMIRAAEDRAPHHPRFALWAHYRGHCEIRLGHVEGAVTAYGDGVERNTSYSLNLATLVAALGLLGREDEALAAREALWRANPDYGVADLEMLAKRMVYWFGTSPSREAFIGAFRRVLEADGVAPASSSAG
jgi:TolB-like protein/lipoprotein NlpI